MVSSFLNILSLFSNPFIANKIIELAIILLLTIVTELTVAFILGFRNKKILLSIICVNIFTNPLLNFGLLIATTFYSVQLTPMLLIILELVVVFVEWQLLVYVVRRRQKRLLALSLILNTASFLVGIALARIALALY